MAFGFGVTGGAPAFNFAGSYNINPSPQSGSGAYGAVPGPTGIPPSIFSQVQGQYPNLPALTGKAFDFAQSELEGRLSTDTIRTIQDQAAAWGAANGMTGFAPGTLAGNMGLRNLGLNVEQLQQKGATDFQSILASIGATETNPNLAAEIASSNAALASAPNPAQSAAALEALFLQNLQKEYALGTAGPAGGTGKYGYSPVRSGPNLGTSSPVAAPGGAPLPSTVGTGTYYGGVLYPAGTRPTNTTQPGYQLNPMYSNPASPVAEDYLWADPNNLFGDMTMNDFGETGF